MFFLRPFVVLGIIFWSFCLLFKVRDSGGRGSKPRVTRAYILLWVDSVGQGLRQMPVGGRRGSPYMTEREGKGGGTFLKNVSVVFLTV